MGKAWKLQCYLGSRVWENWIYLLYALVEMPSPALYVPLRVPQRPKGPYQGPMLLTLELREGCLLWDVEIKGRDRGTAEVPVS